MDASNVLGLLGVSSFFGVLMSAIAQLIVSSVKKRHDTVNSETTEEKGNIKLCMSGIQMLLMDRLGQMGDYYIEQEWIPVHKKRTFDRAYQIYHSMGQNGIMTDTYNKVMALDTINPNRKENEDNE